MPRDAGTSTGRTNRREQRCCESCARSQPAARHLGVAPRPHASSTTLLVARGAVILLTKALSATAAPDMMEAPAPTQPSARMRGSALEPEEAGRATPLRPALGGAVFQRRARGAWRAVHEGHSLRVPHRAAGAHARACFPTAVASRRERRRPRRPDPTRPPTHAEVRRGRRPQPAPRLVPPATRARRPRARPAPLSRRGAAPTGRVGAHPPRRPTPRCSRRRPGHPPAHGNPQVRATTAAARR